MQFKDRWYCGLQVTLMKFSSVQIRREEEVEKEESLEVKEIKRET